MESEPLHSAWPAVTAPPNYTHTQLARFKRGLKRRDDLYGMLGQEAALLPIRASSKAPVHKHHQRVNLGAMENPDWIAGLGDPDCGIAVLLGEASNGLCTLDFDHGNRREEFLALNPQFANTLETAAKRGGNLWFVLQNGSADSFDIREPEGSGNVMEFRGNKRLTIIAGTHPSGVKYRVVNQAKPIRVRWSEVRLPESWPKPGVRAVATEPAEEDDGPTAKPPMTEAGTKYGPPYYVDDKGRVEMNQQSLAAHFCEAVLICCFRGAGFFEYDATTGVWLPKTLATVKVAIGDFIGELHAAEGHGALLTQRTDRFLGEVANLVAGLSEVPWSPGAASTDVLHLGNGMLDLRASPPRLLPFSPDYHSLAGVPHAFVAGAECPRFESFLDVALDTDDAVLLQKFSGMVLSKVNFAQAIVLLTGVAGAGKGTFVDIVQRIVGRSNCVQLRTNLLDQRFELSRFMGKSLLVGPDVRGDFLNLQGAQMLKSLTGGDVLDAELKGQNSVLALTGVFNIVITSNRRLRVAVDEDEDAWRRRLKIVRFTRKAERAVPGLAEILVDAEAPGILNWMIDGLLMLKADFREHGRWLLSARQEELIDDLLAESDSIRAFVRHEVVRGSDGDSLITEELLRAYEVFCSDRSWVPQSKNVVSRQLANVLGDMFSIHLRHDVERGGSSRRGYLGIKLRNPVVLSDPNLRRFGEDQHVPDKF